MYRITSNAGLDSTFTDPIEVDRILVEHLAEHTPRQTVTWTITTPSGDDLPGAARRTHRPVGSADLTDAVHEITTSLLWHHHTHPVTP